MQLMLSIERTRGVTRLPHWLVGTDKICCGGEKDQQAKGDKMHDYGSYFSFVCCKEMVCAGGSIPAACDTIYTSVTSRLDQDHTGLD